MSDLAIATSLLPVNEAMPSLRSAATGGRPGLASAFSCGDAQDRSTEWAGQHSSFSESRVLRQTSNRDTSATPPFAKPLRINDLRTPYADPRRCELTLDST